MLSYRHGYHAGNHADVLKHLTLTLILRHLNAKDKPYVCLDTHAGAGMYDLRGHLSSAHHEYEDGIGRIIGHAKLRQLVPEYFALIDELNPGGDLRLYPGSPAIAAALLREGDHLIANDLHPTDFELLREFLGHQRGRRAEKGEALAFVKAHLPPTPRRGLCLIDPPYEEKNEYQLTLKLLREGLRRWPVGIFALWYPVLGRVADHSRNLIQEVKRLKVETLRVELRVGAQAEERGMCGSGMLILNYPYALDTDLKPVLALLEEALADNSGSRVLAAL